MAQSSPSLFPSHFLSHSSLSYPNKGRTAQRKYFKNVDVLKCLYLFPMSSTVCFIKRVILEKREAALMKGKLHSSLEHEKNIQVKCSTLICHWTVKTWSMATTWPYISRHEIDVTQTKPTHHSSMHSFILQWVGPAATNVPPKSVGSSGYVVHHLGLALSYETNHFLAIREAAQFTTQTWLCLQAWC